MGTLIGLMFGAGVVLVLWQPPTLLQRQRQRPVPVVHWPAYIDDVASGVRAGMNLPQSVWQAGRRLHPVIAGVFARWEQNWALGCGFAAALQGVVSELEQPTFARFAQTVDLAHRQGGVSIATVLTQLSQQIRAHQQLLDEVHGRQAVTVTSARVATLAPWVVLLLTCARPEVRNTYATATGIGVLVAVLLASLVAYAAMRSLARIPAIEVLQ